MDPTEEDFRSCCGLLMKIRVVGAGGSPTTLRSSLGSLASDVERCESGLFLRVIVIRLQCHLCV